MASSTIGSYLYRQGASAQTETVVSTRFKIYTPVVNIGLLTKMGVCSSFQISESKNIEEVRGLGYGDQIAELVPGVTAAMSLTVTRTALYLGNLMQQFGYKAGVSGVVRSLKHHKWPFDIKTEIVYSELASMDTAAQGVNAPGAQKAQGLGPGNPGLLCVATIYEGCWMASYGTQYQVDQAAVTENCDIKVTDILDCTGDIYGEFINSGNAQTDKTGWSFLFNENNPQVSIQENSQS